MPTYVYECSACEQIYEVEQRIVEDALTDCHCGAKGSVKRIIQPTAIMFKGSGFYVNDSQNATNPTTKPAETAKPAAEATPAATPTAE
jgi:putative FmdB family regulatory protein